MLLIFLLLFPLISSMPCPSKCICKPIDMFDIDYTRMSYLIDCSNQIFSTNQLVYRAEKESINEEKILIDDLNDSINDYLISLDLSNNTSIQQFKSDTIQLTDFSFSIQSLSLANQPESFRLHTNCFNSPIYTNLKFLNLSSCCQRIPNECSQLFQPLTQLQILDLSRSNLYKTCLSNSDSIYPSLTDLILRNNIYDVKTFANDSQLFSSVRTLSGKLDLQNSRLDFSLESSTEGNCLFNIFQQITILDLSSIEIPTDDIQPYLSYLLQCELPNGEQLLDLYLRQLKLQFFPKWFNNTRFPLLRRLDLSLNNLYSIDISTFTNLRHLSLASNPIELERIIWRDDTIYSSINLRRTTTNRTFDLTRRLKNLFKLTTNIDFSDNQPIHLSNLNEISLEIDFVSDSISLNISRMNIQSFTMLLDGLTQFDISSNLLTELNLDSYTRLTSLDCSNQYLKQLKFNEQLTTLIDLNCSNNSLTNIENFARLQTNDLRSLDLSMNSIVSLENLFGNVSRRLLRRIYLQWNSIEKIPSNIFHRKFIHLYEINLSWNRIHTIKINAFQSPNLQILDLTGNPLINIQPRSILTNSLRIFSIFNDTQQLSKRCLKSSSTNDTLLSLYANWYVRMKTDEIDRCLNRYVNQTKTRWIVRVKKNYLKFKMIYLSVFFGLIIVVFAGIYLHRKKQLWFLQRYRRLDEPKLIEMDQYPCEDEEIVMNLRQTPFSRVPTDES